MKRLIVLFAVAAVFVSCGKDKKDLDKAVNLDKPVSIEIGATYAKDDSLVVFYKLDGNYMYDKPISKPIKGSASPQKITFDIPAGIRPENFSIVVSTNKDQAAVIITEITVKNGDNVIDGKNYKYFDFFVADNSLLFDEKTGAFTLTHTNKYPPAIVGKDVLETKI